MPPKSTAHGSKKGESDCNRLSPNEVPQPLPPILAVPDATEDECSEKVVPPTPSAVQPPLPPILVAHDALGDSVESRMGKADTSRVTLASSPEPGRSLTAEVIDADVETAEADPPETQEQTSDSSDLITADVARLSAGVNNDAERGSGAHVVPEAYRVTSFSAYDAELVRPWYKQKRFLLPIPFLLAAIILLGVLLGGKKDEVVVRVAAQNVCKPQVNDCGPDFPCPEGTCCSEEGYCGVAETHCGECCQQGSCWDASLSSNSSVTYYNAENDSRLMAFVGNWEKCPSPEHVRQYSHIVIAASVTYQYAPVKNICDKQCDVGKSVNVCGNQERQDLVSEWRALGKKVIIAFGGEGMGGSTSASQNHCWDYCFEKEEEVANNLVDIVKKQNFDGVTIDYGYCYDINRTQYGRCVRRTNLYSDEKAQYFLSTLTSKLRMKLDELGEQTNQVYELSHAPLDQDLLPESKYFQLLQKQRAELDYIMPRFYNGISQPGLHGVFGQDEKIRSVAGDIYTSLVNDMFDGQAHKVRIIRLSLRLNHVMSVLNSLNLPVN